MASENSGAAPKGEPTGAGKKKKDERVDKALDATFPASDPVTAGHETGDEPANVSKSRRTPPLDTALVEKLARELKQTTKND